MFHALDADPSRRIRLLAGLVAVPLLVVAVRVGTLQASRTAEVVARWTALTRTVEPVPAPDGRILTADGAVLARDDPVFDLSVHYRRLEDPPDPGWLRGEVLARLSRSDLKDTKKYADALAAVLAERDALRDRLAEVVGVPRDELRRRFAAVQARVERMRATVLRVRGERDATPAGDDADGAGGWVSAVRSALTTPPARGDAGPLVLAEELDYHRVAADLPLRAAAAVEGSPERYPDVRVTPRTRRRYAPRPAVAHAVGVRTASAEDGSEVRIGRTGVEAAADSALRGIPGERVLWKDRRGVVRRSGDGTPPRVGRDVTLCLHLGLQEQIAARLEAAMSAPDATAVGAAVVVMDVRDGALLAAVGVPTFDPSRRGDADYWAAVLADPHAPLLDRVSRAAFPPGSVLKPAVAAAALETGAITAGGLFECRGFLDRPERHRCLIYRRHGYGHGPVTVDDALCESCNVFFFHAADAAGARDTLRWVRRFGFGRPTGSDLPGESAGSLPGSDGEEITRDALLEAAVGQGTVTATPLQVTRMTAALANGGVLVTPHLVASVGGETPGTRPERPAHPRTRIPGLTPATLAAVRRGMERAVNDPSGTAYRTVRHPDVRVAGKTGTAEVGGERADHAWFTGYLPADRPRYAVTVLLEHGGGGGSHAGPVARDVVDALLAAGLVE